MTKAKRRGASEPSAATWALDSWKDLNDYLRTCDESDATKLLDVEKARPKQRKQFIMRIHSRINRLRRRREREELKGVTP